MAEEIISITVDADTQQRMEECARYMPYAERPHSCTETSLRTLGILTEGTFQHVAQGHRAGIYTASNDLAVSELISHATNVPIIMRETTLDEIYRQLLPNTATILCGSRPVGIGHTMIATMSADNIRVLMDPSTNQSAIGDDAIRAHLAEYNRFHVPMMRTVDTLNLRATPIGGMNPNILRINLTTLNSIPHLIKCNESHDMYTILGCFADKIFSNPNSKLTLSSTQISSLLTGMKPNTASVIYGEKGHTMILVKQKDLILMEMNGRKIIGSSHIHNYLDTFKQILVLMDSKSGGKRKTKRKRSRAKH